MWRQEMSASCVSMCVCSCWDCDGSSWLCAQPSVVSLAWQRLFKEASLTLGHAIALAARASRRCEAEGGDGTACLYVCVDVWCVYNHSVRLVRSFRHPYILA